MLFTNFLKDQNLINNKENSHINNQQKHCIIQKKQTQPMASSTPGPQPQPQLFDQQTKLYESTPQGNYSQKVIPDLEHITNLLKSKKSLSKSPQKNLQSKEQQGSTKISKKLCLNCQKFISSSDTTTHQKQCKGFNELLTFSKSGLRDFILQKILTQQMLLSEIKSLQSRSSAQQEKIKLIQQKIKHFVRMKKRIQTKMLIKLQ